MEASTEAPPAADAAGAPSAAAPPPSESQPTDDPSTSAQPDAVDASSSGNQRSNDGDDGAEPPLSKKQLKKRRRWEKALAVKRRRKEQEREIKRIKAEKEGRDLDAERARQEQNEREGKGWAKREAKWKEITERANIDTSFRVCFDCAFEDSMTNKEVNSLSLQLRYTYAVNRKSSMPVNIDVCGLKKGCATREGMEKIEGFPDKWVQRAFHCYEGSLEDVYSGKKSNGDGSEANAASNGGTEKSHEAEAEGENNAQETDGTDAKEGTINTSDPSGGGGADPPLPNLPPGHQFVYLTGDSTETLSTLDDNTTYIIGGIVDRNRLKRAAIDRAESIASSHPSLKIRTARLPLDEHFDFKASTRILTCNHVFEILQKFRENGYKDWKSSVEAVLPCRKGVEEKKDGGKEDGEEKD